MSTNQQKASWLAGLLTGWGIKESWAKIIAGAVIGALAAAGVLTCSGCTVSWSIGADGSQMYEHALSIPVELLEEPK